MNVSELAFAIEDFLRPFTGDAERFGKLSKQFDDLSDMVVVFAIFGASLWIKEVIACNELKDLIMLAANRPRQSICLP